ncbi:MAG: site-specific DNA-methyltransferase [Caulobacteraceae bacterium]|nr:site-specific DNA-methyltransferase [Caulobacteraceae bacterium]
MISNAIIKVGDVREKLKEIASNSIQSVVTSPPYWALRDYGHDKQIGLEQTPDAYIAEMVAVFREVHRVLADDGTLWLNVGDSYTPTGKGSTKSNLNVNTHGYLQQTPGQSAKETHLDRTLFKSGTRPKELVGIPWRLAFALQADGWYLRQDIIWHKPNPMPESITDRCTKAHEYLFLLSKSPRYYFNNEAIKEPALWADDNRAGQGRLTYHGKRQGQSGSGQEAFVSIKEKRNKRDVWTIPTKPFKGAHFAVMPEALVEPCILAGSKPDDIILDPFMGSGTVAVVALQNNRNFIGCELNDDYIAIAENRIAENGLLYSELLIERKP